MAMSEVTALEGLALGAVLAVVVVALGCGLVLLIFDLVGFAWSDYRTRRAWRRWMALEADDGTPLPAHLLDDAPERDDRKDQR